MYQALCMRVKLSNVYVNLTKAPINLTHYFGLSMELDFTDMSQRVDQVLNIRSSTMIKQRLLWITKYFKW